MANNYTQCSFEIKLRTKEEREFLEEMNSHATAIADEDSEAKEELLDKSVKEEGWGWNMEMDKESIIFYLEETGNIDAMVIGLQTFLGKFRPEEKISISWAYTCSKMRPGEFGGGGVVFNATQMRWVDIHEELTKHTFPLPFHS